MEPESQRKKKGRDAFQFTLCTQLSKPTVWLFDPMLRLSQRALLPLRHREHSAAFLGCARSTVANGHLGVMTHMLIGEDVPNKIGPLASLTPANVSDALRVVLHGFAVIGLLEEWDASLRLFHATLMPAVPIAESERLNVHPSNASVESSPEVPRRPCEASRHYDEGRSVFDRRLADALTLDPDQIVYAEARRVFCRSYAQRVLGCDGDACDSAQLPLSCRAPCVLTQLPAATTVDALVAKEGETRRSRSKRVKGGRA